MNRRTFITKGLALAASSLFSFPSFCQTSDCVPDVKKTITSYLISHSEVPTTIAGDVFLGYSPIGLDHFFNAFPNETVPCTYNLLVGSAIDGLHEQLVFTQKPICGRTNIVDMWTEAKKCQGLYLKKSEELSSTTEKLLLSLPHDYNTKVEKIIDVLLSSLRSVRYKAHTNWYGLPKTLPVLRTDNEGDCKDFALGRYTIARALGVKPEHVFIVCYLKPAHTNLAIFNPQCDVWTILEGTGRENHQLLGQSFSYENEGKCWEYFNKLLPPYIPVLGITNGHVFGFNSIKSYNKLTDELVRNPPQTLPQKDGEMQIRILDPILPQPQTKYNYRPAEQHALGT